MEKSVNLKNNKIVFALIWAMIIVIIALFIVGKINDYARLAEHQEIEAATALLLAGNIQVAAPVFERYKDHPVYSVVWEFSGHYALLLMRQGAPEEQVYRALQIAYNGRPYVLLRPEFRETFSDFIIDWEGSSRE